MPKLVNKSLTAWGCLTRAWLDRLLHHSTTINIRGESYRLKEPHHGQMRADGAKDSGEVTDFVWEPRNDGIHFVCEELPSPRFVDWRAARYLHSIYDPGSKIIVHFDGALRIYTGEQLRERQKQHVRNAGKAGTRIKIFRIDKPLERDAFSLVAQAFFVWNTDLATYFRQTLKSAYESVSD